MQRDLHDRLHLVGGDLEFSVAARAHLTHGAFIVVQPPKVDRDPSTQAEAGRSGRCGGDSVRRRAPLRRWTRRTTCPAVQPSASWCGPSSPIRRSRCRAPPAPADRTRRCPAQPLLSPTPRRTRRAAGRARPSSGAPRPDDPRGPILAGTDDASERAPMDGYRGANGPPSSPSALGATRPRRQTGDPNRSPSAKSYSRAATAARNSIRCTARIGVAPAAGTAAVQDGASRPAAA